jgi:hypothetical protein
MIITNYADFRNIFGAGEPAADDGLPRWPVDKVLSVIVPPYGIIKPFTSWQFNWPKRVAATLGADSVINVDEWHWYLLQPTETTTPRMQLNRDDNLPTATHSGRVEIALTAAGLTAVAGPDGAPLYSAVNIDKLFRGCYIYVFNIGDEEISIVDLHRCAFAASSI